MSGSNTSDGEHPVQDERFGIHEIPERKELIADIPEVRNMNLHTEIANFGARDIVDTILKNTKAIKECISDQLNIDQESD
jgi:hypothetical protein